MNYTSRSKVDLDKLSKSRRVVIFEGFSISKSFKKRIRVKNLTFNRRLRILTINRNFPLKEILHWSLKSYSCFSQVRQDNLGSFCLSCSTLSSDNNTLVLSVDEQILVRLLCYHKKMRFGSF